MDRKNNLEYFFRYYRDIAKTYPDFYMSSDYFYKELQKYGVTNYDNKAIYNYMFRYWQDRYQNIPNIDVYTSNQQPGFLQFANSHHKSNHLKMYLSLQESKYHINFILLITLDR